jgi:hypothetical protein
MKHPRVPTTFAAKIKSKGKQKQEGTNSSHRKPSASGKSAKNVTVIIVVNLVIIGNNTGNICRMSSTTIGSRERSRSISQNMKKKSFMLLLHLGQEVSQQIDSLILQLQSISLTRVIELLSL